MRFARYFPLFSAIACSESAEETALIEFVEKIDNLAVVHLSATADIYHLTCSGDLLQVFELPGDQSSLVANRVDYVADRNVGYYLNDEFVYPTFDLGCDVVECVPVQWKPNASLISYHLEDELQDPPADYVEYVEENGWGEEPARQVPTVTHTLLTGSVELKLNYYLTSTCIDDPINTEGFEFLIE